MKPNNNISGDLYTPEIRRYIEGQMSSSEQHNFEKRMLDDPFLNDAVEGYRAIPDWGTSFNKPAQSSKLFKFFSFATVTVVIGIIAFVLLRKDEPESSVQLSESTISPEKVDQTEHEVIQVEEVRSSDSSVSVLISRTENFPTIQVEENFVQQLDPATLQPLPTMENRPTEAI